jgi:hypothetical protein
MRTEQLLMRQMHDSVTPRAAEPQMPQMHDFLAEPNGPRTGVKQ